ncbi:MAG: hypothetical protein AB1810_06050 [Pseudomonadota bacterium]
MFGKYLKYALCAFLVSVPFELVFAVPAAPGWRTYTQPSGETFTGALRGDEFFNFTVRATQEAINQDPAGSGSYPSGEYTIGQDARGVWYYVQEYVNPNDSTALQVLGNVPAHLPPPAGLSPRILPTQLKHTLPGTAHLTGISVAGDIYDRAFIVPANPIDTSVIKLALYSVDAAWCDTKTTSTAVSGNNITMEITSYQSPVPCPPTVESRFSVYEIGALTGGDYRVEIKKTLFDSNGAFISSQVTAGGPFYVTPTTSTPPQGTFNAPTTVAANPDGSFNYHAVYTPASPTALASYTISNVANTDPPGLVADGFCLGPATMDPKTVSVHGKLVDLTQNGVVSITFSACNGDYFYAETTITPPAPVDPCVSNPAAPGCPAGDDDNDGVKNSRDRCPGTASGVRVNRAGCATPVKKPPRTDHAGSD